MISITEENYLKSIYHLYSTGDQLPVSTNSLAELTQTTAASVSDMLRKLADKDYIHYKKYQGVTLTEKGNSIALAVIRRHRLWEVFLVEKLGFGWDEIHEIAEELEHITSKVLIDRLDIFLGSPKFDPHGDPIPDVEGQLPERLSVPLSTLKSGSKAIILGVLEDSSAFLQHLDKLNFKIGLELFVKDFSDFDKSLEVETAAGTLTRISAEVARNIMVKVLT